MSTAGHTPNFVAESSIYPFRCVKVGTAPFKAVPSTANPEILLGVTDGSIQTFNGTYHATAGQTISLQNGEFVQLTASGSITVGDTLIATTDGKVEASVSATEYIAQAAENANDGEIFWAKKIGAWTVSGGGPSPIGGGWPVPESKALWSCEFTGAVPNFTNTPTTAAFAPGPDFYFQTLNSASGVVEQNAFNVNGHFGVVDATNAEFTNAANWIMETLLRRIGEVLRTAASPEQHLHKTIMSSSRFGGHSPRSSLICPMCGRSLLDAGGRTDHIRLTTLVEQIRRRASCSLPQTQARTGFAAHGSLVRVRQIFPSITTTTPESLTPMCGTT